MATALSRYPTKAEITRAVGAARAANVIVGGLEISRDGRIRILEPRPPEPSAVDSAFERWKASQQDN